MPKELPKGPPEWEAVPEAPPPAAASSSEGMEHARDMARRYLPDVVRLHAGVAFGADSEASLWVRVNCARQLAELAGAIPQAVPEAPPRSSGDGRGAD